MEQLLKVRVGGGDVESGLLPVRAGDMLQELLTTLQEEGGDPELWKNSNPHFRIIGAKSTLASVHVNFAHQLRPIVRTFKEKAEAFRLGRRGYDFVTGNITAQTPWSYIEIIPIDGDLDEAPIRFDFAYRERIEREQQFHLRGEDEIYATVLRAGGEPPSGPTVQLRLSDGATKTFSVDSAAVSKQLGRELYNTVRLRVESAWNPVTLELSSLKVLGLLDWEDVHLYDLVLRHGGTLPLELTVGSVEALLKDRRED